MTGPTRILYLDATYLKATWAGAVRNVALLVAVGLSEEGYREVLSVEVAPGERTEGYRSLLKSLIERGLRGVHLVISDDHEAIKQAVKVELPQAAWQRCVVHFERNVLAHVPQSEMKVVASDLKVIFQAACRETAEQLAASFSERYKEVYPKAVAVLKRGSFGGADLHGVSVESPQVHPDDQWLGAALPGGQAAYAGRRGVPE